MIAAKLNQLFEIKLLVDAMNPDNLLKDFDLGEKNNPHSYYQKLCAEFDLDSKFTKNGSDLDADLKYLSDSDLETEEKVNLALLYVGREINLDEAKRKQVARFYTGNLKLIQQSAERLELPWEELGPLYDNETEVRLYSDQETEGKFNKITQDRLNIFDKVDGKTILDKDITPYQKKLISQAESNFYRDLSSLKGAPEPDAEAMGEWAERIHRKDDRSLVTPHRFYLDLLDQGFSKNYDFRFALRGSTEDYDSLFNWHPRSPESEEALNTLTDWLHILSLLDEVKDKSEQPILKEMITYNQRKDKELVEELEEPFETGKIDDYR